VRPSLVAELFLDASYAIALSSVSDKHHEQALTLARDIEINPTVRLVTTRAVLLEIGNALARQKYRSIAVQLLESIENDSTVMIVPLSEALCATAMQLFQARADKEWGLTDCVSFVVMQERAITDALTADAHFQQAGFRSLLLG
jgi:predicted nucleic acid-binding protein